MTTAETGTRTRDRELIQRWRAGDASALSDLCHNQTGLVHNAAARYTSARVDYEDRLALGFEGVVRAAHGFDMDRRGPDGQLISFSTAAAFWIKAFILNAVLDRLTTRGQRKAFYRYPKVERDLIAAGVEPTDAAVAAVITSDACTVTENDIARCRAQTHHDVSLDQPIDNRGHSGHGDPTTMLDIIESDQRDQGEVYQEGVSHQHQSAALIASLTHLKPRERTIILRRWLADEPKTLTEVGEELGVCRERARQIEARAFRKLRHVFGALDLTVFTDKKEHYYGKRRRPAAGKALVPGSRRPARRDGGCRRMGCAGKPGRPCKVCVRARTGSGGDCPPQRRA